MVSIFMWIDFQSHAHTMCWGFSSFARFTFTNQIESMRIQYVLFYWRELMSISSIWELPLFRFLSIFIMLLNLIVSIDVIALCLYYVRLLQIRTNKNKNFFQKLRKSLKMINQFDSLNTWKWWNHDQYQNPLTLNVFRTCISDFHCWNFNMIFICYLAQCMKCKELKRWCNYIICSSMKCYQCIIRAERATLQFS